jgi:arylsulfatase B
MTRRSFLTIPAAAATLAQERRPNVVLIVADDLGYGELGCQGNGQIPTPNIDSIARNGVRFTNGYVSAPFCCPSRAGLMTGRYQTRFGHELNAVGRRNLEPGVGLPLTEATLADHLKKAGYVTAAIGKWHLGARPEFHPQKRGFDEFFGFLQEGHFFVPPPYRGVTTRLRPNEPPYDDENFIMRGSQIVEEKDYLTDAFTREAVAFIERHRTSPFFLYLPYNAVHSPMQATTAEMKRFNGIGDEHRQVFAAMLSSLDNGVGALLQAIRSNGLEDNTIVVFISDNGGPTGELTSSNKPLRGGKGQLWEGGIRVPFLLQWKGQFRGGRVMDEPVISLDLVPTIAAAAGISLPSSLPFDGVDLLPVLRGGKQLGQRNLFWRYGSNIALRRGDWKLIRQAERGQRSAEFALFNLRQDPGETSNRLAEQSALASELQAELQRLNAQMVAPLWGT